MKSVLLGIGAMIVISALAWAIMATQSETSAEALASSNSVRLN